MTATVVERPHLLSKRSRVRFVNSFTMFRFLTGCFLGAGVLGLVLQPKDVTHLILLIAALASDLEGYLARWLDAVTPWGAAFDPIADGSLFIALGAGALATKELSQEVILTYGIPIIGLITYALVAGLMRRWDMIRETSTEAKLTVFAVAASVLLSDCTQTFGWSHEFEKLAIEWVWGALLLSLIALYEYCHKYRARAV